MSAVAARGLAVGYGAGPVLSEVEFEAEPGTGVCVLGPNGGGKTTLFRALTGELEPLDGHGRGRRPARPGRPDRARAARLPRERAGRGADGGARPAGAGGCRPRQRRPRRRAAAPRRGSGSATRRDTRFGELSGGQRQRVAIARALVADSPVLLLDEPLSGVDPASAELITKLFAELREEGRTLLVSTHDVESARHFDLVLCLNGRQVAFGPPAQVLGREVLERTYGSEIVVLSEDGEPLRAIAVQHHEH